MAMPDLLLTIYSKKNFSPKPFGVNLKFIPCTTDTRFALTKSARKMVQSAKLKQKAFLQSIHIANSKSIQGLDYAISDGELTLTLRQVLMAMRSHQDSDDENWNGTAINFAVHKDLEEEARKVIPALPIVLEAQLGSLIWTWSTMVRWPTNPTPPASVQWRPTRVLPEMPTQAAIAVCAPIETLCATCT